MPGVGSLPGLLIKSLLRINNQSCYRAAASPMGAAVIPAAPIQALCLHPLVCLQLSDVQVGVQHLPDAVSASWSQFQWRKSKPTIKTHYHFYL